MIQARLHAWFAGAHTAYTRPVDSDFCKSADQSAGGVVGVPMLAVSVRHEHDAHSVRSRLFTHRRIG